MRTDTKKIINLLNKDKSIALVGSAGSGKTWFVLNKLMPELEENNKKVEYFKDPEGPVTPSESTDIVVIDEFETFVDKDFLQKSHPEEQPYYSKEYIDQVGSWLEKAKRIDKQMVLVVTRDEGDIDNFLGNVSVTDWGSSIVPIRFYREES